MMLNGEFSVIHHTLHLPTFNEMRAEVATTTISPFAALEGARVKVWLFLMGVGFEIRWDGRTYKF